jgi:protoporphyrinogen oxidase
MQARQDKKVVIIGGGPAGLTAAYELSKANVRSVVLEKEPVVGGLSKTVARGGNLFDLGGHRFFTKVKAVDDLWREVLQKSDFLRRKRLSRIYYNRKFFDYPLRISNVLAGLGVWNSVLILLSYARARAFPERPEPTFEKWVSNRFGRRLYRVFFKSYTEKVWGIPCEEITADWAEQRIRGLSLWSAVKEAATRGKGRGGETIKTLTREFNYPRRGPGMMWEAVADMVEGGGGEIRRGAEVSRILHDGRRVAAVEVTRDGARELITGTDFISSMPVRELFEKLEPPPPAPVLAAAARLGYRDFILVGLSVARENVFADNWLYIHDPRVGVGRIQNFGNWSPDMVRPGRTCLGMEYFCFEGDEMWSADDAGLVARATRELQALGLVEPAEVEEGFVVRVPKAYPIQDSSLDEAMREIRAFLKGVENLQLVGRNGMHKYNNQDHSMLTAMLAAENILGGDEDVWGVNVEPVYHEQEQDEGRPRKGSAHDLSLTQPLAPRRVAPADKAAEG